MWFRKNGRKLPWRETKDPYPILVSEMMLQQTQVKRALEFYPRFLQAFPTWKNLAKATNAEVIAVWSGLGYNRRALMLRDIARQVVDQGVPNSEEEWRTLKGIGPYTAAALSAFTLKGRTMPIDTNIRRVLGRVLLGKTYPANTSDAVIQKKSQKVFVKEKDVHDVPQALFDLATSICAKIPNCASCPLRNDCLAAPKFLSGRVRVPKAMIKKANEHKHEGKPHPDRIYRGRILKLVLDEPGIALKNIGSRIDPSFNKTKDEEWLFAMIHRLEKDGMIAHRKGKLSVIS